MLKLDNIKKDYIAGDIVVNALKGITLEFRKSEFVAILGPSGCGKTTLLNIVGGLDRYTSGDLIIKGRSTKDFKDRDWDTYRNHSVGFVFQSYNLIPHQTVLGNVELALTIGGMSKPERVAKAKAALDKVGLSDQYHKRPNQLSGGQMQRVAIARALVNDPEIVLADEPTGALDTETSKQIMDLMKEIANDRLVIMVTHNPELAKEYSTRTIKLLDGNLVSDSKPFDGIVEINTSAVAIAVSKAAAEQPLEHTAKGRYKTRTKMSFFTAFRLSLQNLLSKRKRSIMVTIAGSIGIIGVSLVLAFSFGIQGFITNMQADMLAGNPITVEKSAFDINALMSSMGTEEKMKVTMKDGFANISSTVDEIKKRMDSMQNMMVENTITDDYIRFLENIPEKWLAALHYDYGLNLGPNTYTTYRDHDFCDNIGCDKKEANCKINERAISLSTIRSIFGSLLAETDLADYGNLINMVSSSFKQLPANADDYILSQYNLVYGDKISREKNEVMIVLGEDRMLADLMLAQLGYYSQQEFLNIVYRATASDNNNYNIDKIDTTIPDRGDKISYTDLIGKTFTWYENDDIFKSSAPFSVTEPIEISDEMFSPLPYKFDYLEDASKINPLANGVELTIVGILEPKKDLSFGMLENGFYYTSSLAEYIIEQNKLSQIVQHVTGWENGDAWDTGFPTYDDNTPPNIIIDPNTGQPVTMKMRTYPLYYYHYDYLTVDGNKVTNKINGIDYLAESSGMMAMFVGLMGGGGTSVQSLGGSHLPTYIGIYPANLTIKTKVLKYLDQWNNKQDIILSDGYVVKYVLGVDSEGKDILREDIMYQDILSLIFGMIRTMVNLITIALVAFTSLALIVSSVMIGIITYVSVVERIKEIGVIRSLGGRKRDVSNLFTAETFILGLAAGVFGIVFTYIASFIISAIVKGLAGISSIAFLPFGVAVIMITLSVVLTSISGLMPSRSAAKKDPVIALRTE